jgi:ribonucleoside-diphosphate reductase alpha chain
VKINPNIQETLEAQYLQTIGNKLETPEEMLQRAANFVAGAESQWGWSEERIEALASNYFTTMNEGYWLPSSPFLMNAGTSVPMLGACFVLSIEDNTPSIFETLKRAAVVHKMGGGTGFEFSPLRAKGSPIKSTGGTSTGVLSFISLFDAEGKVIKQGGRRRSANLAGLRIDHPEILDFINAKLEKGAFENFNFSVIIPDWFMKRLEEDGVYNLLDHNGDVVNVLSAREVFIKIVENNWKCAEPGVLFLDNLNKDNKMIHLGEIRVTNPCGEQPLRPEEACNLASINLEAIVQTIGNPPRIDYTKVDLVTSLVTRFLDSSIDVNMFPLPEIEAAVKETRKIGIGILGLHGLLIKLGERYDTQRGRELAKQIMERISQRSIETSILLGKQKGVPSGWQGSQWEKRGMTVRNLAHTSIAPTGTIGMLLDVSSYGCEPIFKVVHARKTRGIDYRWINPLFEKIAREEGWFSEELLEQIINNEGRVTGLSSVPQKWRDLFITADEIAPIDHIKMQAALQEVVDGGISKTINMPADATISQVYEAYMQAWKLGCKGLTIYREGSREGVLTTIDPKVSEGIDLGVKLRNSIETPIEPKATRPDILLGVTSKIQSGCGKLWITINPYSGQIWEVFASTGSDGGCTSNIQEIARLSSLLCREGVDIAKVIDQLRSTKCARAIANPNCKVKSCSDAIAKKIEEFLAMSNRVDWDTILAKLQNQGTGIRRELAAGKDVISDYVIEEKDFIKELTNLGCRSGNCD